MYSVYKGLGFVAVTATLLFVGIRSAFRRERQATHRIAQSESLLRAITDTIPDPVYLKDRDGRWLFANPATLLVVGKTADQVAGRTDVEIFGGATGAAIMATDRDIMDRGTAHVMEEHILEAGGERTFLSSKAPYRDEEGRIIGLVGTSRDITDRKRAERDLLAAAEQLRQAQKLESIGRLAGGVAHDFNNLLTVILSYAHSLESDLKSGDPGDLEAVQGIRQAGERAHDLTRRLLAFARKQVTDPVPLDLAATVGSIEGLLRRVLGDDVELRVSVQPGLSAVLLDPGLLEQVFLNLAVNARDAMPEGGELEIEARNSASRAMAGGRAADGPGDGVLILVRDSGVGMPPEVKDHLFEPFFTTKESGKGTGLGLAMVHGIVTQAGGRIRVESEPGKGTTFEIWFPKLDGEPGRPAARVAPSPARADRGHETVLVVEDDPMVRGVIVRSLRQAGYEVREESNPGDALEYVREHAASFDILVTDVQMPGRSGPAMASEMRRFVPGLPVLFVSGYPADALDGNADGDGFLPKPFTADLLLARIRSMLDRPPKGLMAARASKSNSTPGS
ncbi:MAG TPA: ATP-binding protein [Anaeromyxobacter sp.]|nr:ATP-binding protein [Anaeromyxobacter sp.]